ncbi:MAG: hypothetical protein R3314_05405 [Longimicrobiales bacterium]|nr:hypothetical protein [Longimicrobiales bacterium]
MTRAPVLASVLAIGALVAPTAATPQVPTEEPAARQQQADLAGLLEAIAAYWEDGNAAALAEHGAGAGLELEIAGQLVGSLNGRRAAAALRQLFGGQVTVRVETASVATVVGAEDRAFGELIWEVRMPGAAVTESRKVFVALVREERAWRISQIRILP